MLEQGYDIHNRIGLAGFNGVELLQGLPRQLATMDACRAEIGRRAAQIIVDRTGGIETDASVVLKPQISYGDTLRRP